MGDAPLPYFFIDRYAQSSLDVWSSFVSAAHGERAPEVSSEDGRAARVIGRAARLLPREHRLVTVVEIDTSPASLLATA